MDTSNKIITGVVAIIIVAVGIVIAIKPSSSHPASTTASLASLNTGTAPWIPEYSHLTSRLAAIHMSLLAAEGTAQHIHAHLDIFVDGKAITVPAEIGIPPSGGVTPVHTHDTSGIIHIESPDAHATYTLGQFFDIWGVQLTTNTLGSYKTTTTQTLSVYDNGKPVTDPANLILAAHHEIAVVYGNSQDMPTIPSSYAFPDGL